MTDTVTILGYHNAVPGAALGGSGWDTDYPVTNLQAWPNRARSTGPSATLTASFGAILGPVIGIGRHNLTAAALVSITAGSWSVTNQPCDCFVVPADVSVSSVSISISDSGNPDGFISLGKVFIGQAFRPAAGPDWGQTTGIESTSVVTPAMSGTEFFDRKPARRVWRGKWSWLTQAEAYGVLLEILKTHDVTDDVCLVSGLDAMDNRMRSFVGRLRQLSDVEWPYLNTHACGVEIIEHI